ncbi:hypothetical protein [Vreelandella andesensis]|uniref:hypothetical protein n=1 Tax=Vreelandella andesensis TaxID=447567 RepID=UPI00142DFEBA|nr:hypothetical protein [Halomonas andesensis]
MATGSTRAKVEVPSVKALSFMVFVGASEQQEDIDPFLREVIALVHVVDLVLVSEHKL